MVSKWTTIGSSTTGSTLYTTWSWHFCGMPPEHTFSKWRFLFIQVPLSSGSFSQVGACLKLVLPSSYLFSYRNPPQPLWSDMGLVSMLVLWLWSFRVLFMSQASLCLGTSTWYPTSPTQDVWCMCLLNASKRTVMVKSQTSLDLINNLPYAFFIFNLLFMLY